MAITLVLLMIVFGFILLLVRYHPWRIHLTRIEDLDRQILPISVPALRNLIDARNLEFLQRSLPASEFNKLRRERNRVLRVYVHRISHNARLLVAAAEIAQSSRDPNVIESARSLMQNAIYTRAFASRALMKLYLGDWFPQISPDLIPALESYQSTTSKLDSLLASGSTL